MRLNYNSKSPYTDQINHILNFKLKLILFRFLNKHLLLLVILFKKGKKVSYILDLFNVK